MHCSSCGGIHVVEGYCEGCAADIAQTNADWVAENNRLRAVVEAADKYDNGGSYPALRAALNKWRKAEKKAAAPGTPAEQEGGNR